MADHAQTRSEYLTIMLGERKNALSPYRPEQMNDLGDTSFDAASLSDEDIDSALKQMAGTQYENSELFKAIQSEREKRGGKEEGGKSGWQQFGDFFTNLGTSIFEGVLNVVDAVKDFGLGVVAGVGGGWFGQNSDFTDSIAKMMADDSWMDFATENAVKFMPTPITMLTHIGDSDYWDNYWTWDLGSVRQRRERMYQGQEGVRSVGNFVGEIIPSLALAFATGGSSLAASAAAQGALSFTKGMGEAQSRALSEGASFQSSAGYGLAKGAISGALSAGLTLAGGTFASRSADSVVSKAGSKIGDLVLAKTGNAGLSFAANGATKFIIRVAGDAGEGAVLTAIEPALKQIYDDNAWYNAYGTNENRQRYASQIGKAALTAAALSAVSNVVRSAIEVYRNGGISKAVSDNENASLRRIAENEALKSLSKADRELAAQGAKEWSSIQKEIDRAQAEYDTLRARGASDAEIELYVAKNKQALRERVAEYSSKYNKVYTKLSAKIHPDAATGDVGKLSGERLSAARNESFQKMSSMTSKGLKEQLDGLFNGKEGVVGLISYTEGSKPIETVKEDGTVVAKPKDAEDVQSVLAAFANDPKNAPSVILLPLKNAPYIKLDISVLTPKQARSVAFLGESDAIVTKDNNISFKLPEGKTMVFSIPNQTATIVPTAQTVAVQSAPQAKPLDIKAETNVVKEAAQAKDGDVYSYTQVSKWEDEVNGSLIKVLKDKGADVRGFGTLVGANSDKATLKQVFDNLNLGSKEQVAAIRDAVRNELFTREFTYDLPDAANPGKVVHQKFTFDDLLPQLTDAEKTQLIADFDSMFDKLVAAGKDSRVTVLKKFISEQKDLINKYRQVVRDVRTKKKYSNMLSRTRSKIKDKVTGDYDYGKAEDRDLHTVSMLAKPIASLKRSGGAYKADSDTLDAFLTAQKYYVPENYEEAGSIDFSEDVKDALDLVTNLIKRDVNNQEISADTYAAVWDYQNKVLDYEKELTRVEITERKPSAYAASAEINAYSMSAIQRLIDVIPREFGGAAGEIFMRFGYGEITKKFVIDPVKAYGKAQNEVAKAVEEIGKFMPKGGFHSKHVVGKINGVKVTRGELMAAYISAFLAKDNFQDIEVGGWGVRDKKGSMKWASTGGLESAKADIDNLISDEDKALTESIFKFFNGYLKDWFVRYAKNVRHKVDVEVRKEYYPKFKEKDFRAGVESPVGHTPLFRYEQRTTSDKSGLVIVDVMDVLMDYVKKIAEMENILPAVKAATALRNSKTPNGKIVATEIIDKHGKETMDLLDRTAEGWFKVGKAELDNIVQKGLRFFMHGYATAKLADVIRPVKNYFSYISSNVDLAKMPRAAVSHFSEEIRDDVSWLIDNEIYELKYRFASGDVVKGNAPTVGGEIRRKAENVLMLPVKGVDWFAMKDGLYAIVAEARKRGIDVRSKKGAELVHNIYAVFYLSNVGSTPLHKSKMSEGALRYVFDVLAGAKRAQIASFAMQGSLFHQFKGMTQKQIDDAVEAAKAKVAKAEEATEKANKEYERDVDTLEDMRKARDGLIRRKASEDEIKDAREIVSKAKEIVKERRAAVENAKEEEAKARSEQKKAENAREGYAQYKFAGGKRIPLNILAKAILVGVLTTGVSMLTKWLYGKKNLDEYQIGEIAQDAALNSFVNWLPVVGDLVGAVTRGHQIDAPSVSMINEVISACSELIDSIQAGKVSGAMITAFIDVLEGITGLPLATVKKYVYGIMKMVDPAAAYKFNNVFANASASGMASAAKTYAEKNDISTAASLYQSLYAGHKTGEIDRDVAVEEAKLVAQGFNPIARNVPEYVQDEQGGKAYLTDAQKSGFARRYSDANARVAKLIRSASYRGMDGESKAKAIKKVYDLYYEAARHDALGIEPESKLGKLLAYATGFDDDLVAAILLIQRNAALQATSAQTRKQQAIRLVNGQPMTRVAKLLTLYLMGYGVSEENKKAVRNGLVRMGFTKAQADAFLP